MPNKQSSDELSSLAAKTIRRKPAVLPVVERSTYNELLEDAHRLAASVMSQDETKGKRYDD